MSALLGLGYKHLEYKNSISLNSSKECKRSRSLQNVFRIIMMWSSKKLVTVNEKAETIIFNFLFSKMLLSIMFPNF